MQSGIDEKTPIVERGHVPQTAGFADPKKNIQLFGIEQGMIVADFGAGSGAYTFLVAEIFKSSCCTSIAKMNQIVAGTKILK